MQEARLDKAWQEKGLGSYPLEAILGTLRRYGVSVSEESLRQVGSEEEWARLAQRWQQVWKGTGPFRELPLAAAQELWERLGQHPREAEGLGEAFFQRFQAAPLEEKLALAREAATLPGFNGREAVRLGHPLRRELKAQGRLLELGGVLEAWEAQQPRVLEEAPWALGWRVELALRRPGAEVGEPLRRLAKEPGEYLEPLLPLVEWSLYRGHVAEAAAALEELFSRIGGYEYLMEGAWKELSTRALLVVRDVAWLEPPERNQAVFLEWAERLFGRRLPVWVLPWQEQGLLPWSPVAAWEGTAEQFIQWSEGELNAQQLRLVHALEQTLWGREGWGPGRTQLLHPTLPFLLREAARVEWGSAKHWRRPARLLLPGERVLAVWEQALEEQWWREHCSAATALALRPWGEFLLQRGLVNEGELAEWLGRLRPSLAPLVEWLEHEAEDPELAGEVRRALEEL